MTLAHHRLQAEELAAKIKLCRYLNKPTFMTQDSLYFFIEKVIPDKKKVQKTSAITEIDKAGFTKRKKLKPSFFCNVACPNLVC